LEVPPPSPSPKEADKTRQREDKTAVFERESRASQALVPTAPPRSETLAPVPTAPALSLSPSVARARANWCNVMASHINRSKRYPVEARLHHMEGVVTVQFTVDRRGAVVASKVVHRSGSLLLDDEAMAMLQRSVPLPLPPAEVEGDAFELVLPIHFKMR
jgi:protein TonB